MDKILLLLTSILFLVGTVVRGQSFSVSSAFSFSHYAGNIQNNISGVQIRFTREFKKRGALTAYFEHGLKSSVISAWTDPINQNGWNWSYRIKVDKAYLGYSYYLFRRSLHNFNVYVAGGLSYSMPRVEDSKFLEYQPPSNNNFGNGFGSTSFNWGPGSSIFSINHPKQSQLIAIETGLGFIYQIGKLSLFTEIKYSVPLYQEKLEGNVLVPLATGANLNNECYCTYKVTDRFPLSYSVNAGLKVSILNR
jgi:hypothetical protein